MSLGTLPPASALPTLPAMSRSLGTEGIAAAQASMASSSSLLHLLFPQAEIGQTKQARVWVGDGLPTIPRKVHERILKWDFVDLGDLRPLGALEKLNQEPDPLKFVIMPGLEVARAKKSQITDIQRWVD